MLNMLARNANKVLKNNSACLLIALLSFGVISCTDTKPTSLPQSTKVEHLVQSYITTTNTNGTAFPIVSKDGVTPLWVSSQDYSGVLKVAEHLQADIKRVTGKKSVIVQDKASGKTGIIIGTIGKNPLIDQLIASGKIDASQVAGKWDTYALQTVDNPTSDIAQALVIFGSNKRGTIYGMYDLSRNMGVSPWYWWADAPIQKKHNVYVKPGFYTAGEPKVKYRGIFINDENPSLTNWVVENYGSYNHKFYDKVYELILRNRGNFLWPAMWPGPREISAHAFFADDPMNHKLADEYGVVISTTHHEPMMRAADEWYRGDFGPWDYKTNKDFFQEYWRGGIERMGDYESVVTVGMRGDGDTALPGGTQVELMQSIIRDQREIIEDVTGKPAEKTPQVWAIYKEMQDYWDKGTRVAEDITILFCDDNWGNIKSLPKKSDLARSGGFGIYYHFDYVGGPKSYKWANVTQIEKVWEQMNLAYEHGANEIWVVNVGDIKPHELPTSFFLDFAWNPEKIRQDDLPDYYVQWATEQFGSEHASEIANILALYTKFNARRTPEMIDATTYSVEHYREAERITNEYNELLAQAKTLFNKLPKSHRSSFYQLVLFPVESAANLNEMYVAAAKNKFYIDRGASRSANAYADKTKALFYKDEALHEYFHNELEDGKWNHMMAQTHIGHPHWYSPSINSMPAVQYAHTTGKAADIGFHVEYGTIYHFGGVRFDGLKWHYHNRLPQFDPVNDQSYFIEVFNKGAEDLSYKLEPQHPWVKLTKSQGTIATDEKVYVSIDWKQAPQGLEVGEVLLSGAGVEYTILVPIRNEMPKGKGFIENNGVVSIEAAHYQRAQGKNNIKWITIPNYGRTDSAVTVSPSTADTQSLNASTPHLQYTFTLFDNTDIKLDTYLAPTYNFKRGEGLKFAVSIDDKKPQIVNMHETEGVWGKRAGDHAAIETTEHKSLKAGEHTLKIWMIDAGVVFQKFVLDTGGIKTHEVKSKGVFDSPITNKGGLKPSYLGPPMSHYEN
ncbi:glycosyl hydrolase 115 family protein [Catenovulum adriaticum]|uniref:Glycosyl hydrolase 115 family protein n=1 Tax=Catenovulum adriaticum TaxID=2984846 RepID=A0ABY7AQS6_9ALTE|nr:glycosyl hydrolase 115 family protein [Catenovulum sp. TS8]WAJ71898.1 glycosyl hydrolase 115 family protein [Catenovulum sp. TS8]